MTLAAVDDIIVRGQMGDWLKLRKAVLADRALAKKVLDLGKVRREDMYSHQRYAFWVHYAERSLARLG
jgi:hypothetical protein